MCLGLLDSVDHSYYADNFHLHIYSPETERSFDSEQPIYYLLEVALSLFVAYLNPRIKKLWRKLTGRS